jgi:hypothetical protein
MDLVDLAETLDREAREAELACDRRARFERRRALRKVVA